MKTFKLLITLIISSSIYSQAVPLNYEQPYIEVTGKSELEISPNEIYIDICIKERKESGKKVSIDSIENQLKEKLTLIGIPIENLFISDVNAVISKTGWWSEEILSVANYSLKVNGADKLKKLFDSFQQIKISEATITRATHSNIIELKKKNRIKAIKAAKEKADYLLNAINEKTGKALKVHEVENNSQIYANTNYVNTSSLYNSREKMEISKSFRNKVVQFDNIKIVSSIYVRFAIK